MNVPAEGPRKPDHCRYLETQSLGEAGLFWTGLSVSAARNLIAASRRPEIACVRRPL